MNVCIIINIQSANRIYEESLMFSTQLMLTKCIVGYSNQFEEDNNHANAARAMSNINKLLI